MKTLLEGDECLWSTLEGTHLLYPAIASNHAIWRQQTELRAPITPLAITKTPPNAPYLPLDPTRQPIKLSPLSKVTWIGLIVMINDCSHDTSCFITNSLTNPA